jgi:hypothetical protein
VDSYSLHLSPDALQLTGNQTFLFACLAHTGHRFQPLDVGVCRLLKAAYILPCMITQTKKPKQFKSHSLFNNAYLQSFSSDNNAFPINGIVPLKATELEAVTPLRLPERPVQGKAGPSATPSPSSSRDKDFSRFPALQKEIRVI